MKEFEKTGKVGDSAMKAGMDRKTGRKYLQAGVLPSQLRSERCWRTRDDPFSADWAELETRLEDAPELEAKTLFEDLMLRMPGRYEEGQLRTFQRRVKRWRVTKGPPKEVFFAQEHRPGEAMQTDFTNANELKVTIGGEPFEHLLSNSVLPYSNWQWVSVCQSESLVALHHGVQEAVFRLGKSPPWHQTDNSTAATRSAPKGQGKAKRPFHPKYEGIMRHLGMRPRTIAVGKSNQNGDVESLGGVLKRRLKQHLLLRGHWDFDSVSDYQNWIHKVVHQANGLRHKKLQAELKVMRPVTVQRLPVFTEEDVRVTTWSTIRVKRNTYSVPSRLIRERVRARIFDDRIEVWYGQSHQLTVPRLRGESGREINYRHVIWSLVRKPGAFERYKYRDDMFPTLTFRKAYDWLVDRSGEDKRKADIEYLRILHLAASTMESEVESALELLLEMDALHNSDDVKSLVRQDKPTVPMLAVPRVDLSTYDTLLNQRAAQ